MPPACVDGLKAQDNCSGEVEVVCSAGEVAGEACARSQTFTYTATDACGNAATGTVTFAAHPQPGRYVIATGTQVEAAADLTGWTVGNINPDGWGTSFSLVGGAFVLDVTRRGLMVIIR